MTDRAAGDRYLWFTDGHRGLAEGFCLTVARELTVATALERMGADSATARPLTLAEAGGLAGSFDAGYPPVVLAGERDGWTTVLEPGSFEGSRPPVLRRLSAGGEASSIHTTVNNQMFSYAADGVLVTGFDPTFPDHRWGADPDRFADTMAELGMTDEDLDEDLDEDDLDGDEPAGDARDSYGLALRRALTLQETISGVRLTPDLLAARLVAALVVPLLDDPPTTPAAHKVRRMDGELADAVDAASGDRCRVLAAEEARRLAVQAGVADDDAVDAALTDAHRGVAREVLDESPLGRRIRAWGVESRRAGTSLNDPHARHRMTREQRAAAYARYTAGLAVRAALLDDPRTAAYEVCSTVVPARNPERAARRAEIMRFLRDGTD